MERLAADRSIRRHLHASRGLTCLFRERELKEISVVIVNAFNDLTVYSQKQHVIETRIGSSRKERLKYFLRWIFFTAFIDRKFSSIHQTDTVIFSQTISAVTSIGEFNQWIKGNKATWTSARVTSQTVWQGGSTFSIFCPSWQTRHLWANGNNIFQKRIIDSYRWWYQWQSEWQRSAGPTSKTTDPFNQERETYMAYFKLELSF